MTDPTIPAREGHLWSFVYGHVWELSTILRTAQVSETDSFQGLEKLTRAKVHSTAMTTCIFPKNTEP